MQIDEAGRYEQTRRVDDSVSVDQEAGLDDSDSATNDANVAHIVESDRRVDDRAVLDDQFVLRGRRLLNPMMS
jgi:hypothetical protein